MMNIDVSKLSDIDLQALLSILGEEAKTRALKQRNEDLQALVDAWNIVAERYPDICMTDGDEDGKSKVWFDAPLPCISIDNFESGD